jgi:hypothetical protein
MKIEGVVIDYLGKWMGGILTIVNLKVEGDDNFYESVFYYTEDKVMLVPESKFEEIYYWISETEDYFLLIESLINQVEPHGDIIGNIGEFDPEVL